MNHHPTSRRAAWLLAAAAALAAAGAGAQPPSQPASIGALLDALPELPPTAEQAAAQWVDRRGQTVHPGLLQARQSIAAHRQFVARIGAANAAARQQQGAVTVDALGRGMADAGVDMQRMQSDPAYAQAVQERLRRMTPAEQLAFAQRMNAPLNADPRHVNAAQAMVQDAPAMRAAAEAGEAYVRGQPQRYARQAAIRMEADAAVARLRAVKLVAGVPKPAIEWDSPGCDPACQGRWDAYAARLLP